jgi:hypothetical protein
MTKTNVATTAHAAVSDVMIVFTILRFVCIEPFVVSINNYVCFAAFALRETLIINSFAKAFITIVTINKTSAISINELRYISSVASAKFAASTDAIVYAGSKSDADICGEFPITIVTAIVSPIARPSPRTTAPAIPDAAFPKTILVVSHLVAPSASAASR